MNIKRVRDKILFLTLVGVLIMIGTIGRTAPRKWEWKVDNANRILTISGSGILNLDIDWSEYIDDIDIILIQEGVTGITGKVSSDLDGVPIVLPDSITTIDIKYTRSSASSNTFLYSDQNIAAKDAFPHEMRKMSLEHVWEKVGYRNFDEIYHWDESVTYGWKTICGEIRYICKDGATAYFGWIYDQGYFYYLTEREDRVARLENTTETLLYQTADGEFYQGVFTFDETGRLINESIPSMMAVTIDSRYPVAVASQSKG